MLGRGQQTYIYGLALALVVGLALAVQTGYIELTDSEDGGTNSELQTWEGYLGILHHSEYGEIWFVHTPDDEIYRLWNVKKDGPYDVTGFSEDEYVEVTGRSKWLSTEHGEVIYDIQSITKK